MSLPPLTPENQVIAFVAWTVFCILVGWCFHLVEKIQAKRALRARNRFRFSSTTPKGWDKV